MLTKTKKSTNLSLRSDLLEEARSRKINLSQTLERALEGELKKRREAEWKEQNQHAIDTCNAETREYGMWCDKLRVF